jgi:hypothetical protein
MKMKRARGTGCLLKLPGSRFYHMQYYDEDGKQVRKTTGTESLKEAENILHSRMPALAKTTATFPAPLIEKITSTVFTIKKDVFDLLLKPCAYVFWQNGTALYVGSGYCSTRPLTLGHHRAIRAESDRIEVHTCDNLKAARLLENGLIIKLRPVYNGTWVRKPVA